MKRFFALAALVLGLAACQTEPEGLDVNVGGEVDSYVTVSLPETTRANSAEGAFANIDWDTYTIRYIFQVFYNGDESNAKPQVIYTDGKSVSFPVRLVPNRHYNFVAWADVVPQEGKTTETLLEYDQTADFHYNTSNLKAIKFQGEWKAMDETRDAFSGYYDTNKHGDKTPYNGAKTIDLKLTRPFAKLRVVTTDMVELGHFDIVPHNAVATYTTDHYESFNAFDGTYAGEVSDISHTYEIASYGETGANKTIFADYFFANNEVVKFNLDVKEANGETIKANTFSTDIYVRRNYLTTIQGNILTDGNNVKVDIIDAFEGTTEWPDENKNSEKLAYAAMFGGEVTLTEDVVLTQPLTIVEGANVVINLNGKTISNPTGYGIENYGTLTIDGNGNFEGLGNIRSHAGKVTINGGTFTGSSDWNNGTYQHILKAENTEVVINGGTFDATIKGMTNAMINVSENSVVTINGGTFKNVDDVIPQFAPYMFTYEKNGKLIINDGDFYGGWRFNGETATTDIYGGNFTVSYDGQSFHANSTHVLKVYGGVFSLNNGGKLNPTNHCAADYYALQYETGKYTVQAIDAASRTLTINSKEDFLKLSLLNEKWAEFFSNGQGTTLSDYAAQNGGKGTDFYYKWDWTIKLNVDIDFENATLTAPINVTGFGCFDGQNHTIKNVTIENDTVAGLFISSQYGALKNIKLDNVHAIAGYDGNSCAGILASNCNAGIDNITITNSSAEGGKYTGGVVGYGYTDVTNCTLTDCVVKGGYKCGGVIGYICASDEAGHITGNTLTNCTVAAAPQHADGKSEYILGMVVGNYNCNGTCADNVVYDITTSATKVIGKIEGGKVVNEYNNTVTYVVENYDELKAAIINGGNIEFANDITVDKWIMFSEDLNVATGDIITIDEINVTIDGKGHTLTVNAIESAGNNDQLFQGASVLNISNLTIKYADGLTTGGLGMHSGVIKNVHFIGGGSAASSAAIFPEQGEILVENCTFDTNGVAIYFENKRDNLTVTGCTFNQKDNKNVILLYGDVKFTNNIINSGRTVNVVNGSPVVTGNNFNNVRFKVYGAATATISNNIINNLEFDGNPYASTFSGNTLSAAAEAALNAATKAN